MDRRRIMDAGPDPSSPQVVPQRIAVGEPDHILVEDMGRRRAAYRKCQRQTGETRIVAIRNGLPSRIALRKGSELDAKDCRLDRAEPRIDAGPGADVPLARPVFRKP